jgi:hypothetical protein
MYNGKCPNCGAEYRGWALGNPGLHNCSKCAKPIDISRDDSYQLSIKPKKSINNPDD